MSQNQVVNLILILCLVFVLQIVMAHINVVENAQVMIQDYILTTCK